jgi:hypothetical protein
MSQALLANFYDLVNYWENEIRPIIEEKEYSNELVESINGALMNMGKYWAQRNVSIGIV